MRPGFVGQRLLRTERAIFAESSELDRSSAGKGARSRRTQKTVQSADLCSTLPPLRAPGGGGGSFSLSVTLSVTVTEAREPIVANRGPSPEVSSSMSHTSLLHFLARISPRANPEENGRGQEGAARIGRERCRPPSRKSGTMSSVPPSQPDGGEAQRPHLTAPPTARTGFALSLPRFLHNK